MTGRIGPNCGRALAGLASREKVLSAARRLFVAEGYEAVTLRAVAAETGMSLGTVTGHFDSKATLWRAATGRTAIDALGLARCLAACPDFTEDADAVAMLGMFRAMGRDVAGPMRDRSFYAIGGLQVQREASAVAALTGEAA